MPAKPSSVTPQPGKDDPIHAYHFSVEIDGLVEARFSEASGFQHSTKIIEHRETDKDGNIHINKTIGSTSFSDITIKRGVTTDNSLWENWRQMVMDGDYAKARKKVTIYGHGPDGTRVSAFVMDRCWVSQWKGPAFGTKNDTVAFEEITFTHEGITRSKP